MSNPSGQINRSGVIWKQLLIGQTFGVAFAVLLFLVEFAWLGRQPESPYGVSGATILAIFAGFGWILGIAVGILTGLAGTIFPRLVRSDGTVPGGGPVLGFLFMALFIVRAETTASLGSMPSSIITSLAAAALVWVGLGYLGRRFLYRYVHQSKKAFFLNLLTLVAILIVVGPLALSLRESDRLPEKAPASETSPNIVLIVVDALRPDHLSTYGYKRDTSPNLDQLAERSTVFTNAYSQGNRTIIAMPSLFTSLYPSFHGAIGFGEINVPLPSSRKTIAEICSDIGYTTTGVMSNVYLKSPFGLTNGFDCVEEFETGHYDLSVYRLFRKLGFVKKPTYRGLSPDATSVTDSAIKWLHLSKDGPFFLFMHYMDVHHPYYPPQEYETMFDTNAADIDPQSLFFKTAMMVKQQPPLRLPGGELQRLIDLYDGCIRYTDEEIGRFLRELESLDLDRETIVIFTADHGDEFLENGSLYHVNLATETLIRIPLVVGRYPGRDESEPPRWNDRVKSLVRHIDVLPTIAELTGATVPAAAQGTSLVPVLEGNPAPKAVYSIAEGNYCKSLNMDQWKMMYIDSTGTYQLFDLSNDPRGLVDVSGQYPQKMTEMKDLMDRFIEEAAELQLGSETTLDEETLRQLRALGYIK